MTIHRITEQPIPPNRRLVLYHGGTASQMGHYDPVEDRYVMDDGSCWRYVTHWHEPPEAPWGEERERRSAFREAVKWIAGRGRRVKVAADAE